jgi:hypothetical protein
VESPQGAAVLGDHLPGWQVATTRGSGCDFMVGGKPGCMSRWAVVIAGLVVVGFLSLPLLLGRPSRSGRMARWDARAGSGRLSVRQQRIAWRLSLGFRSFMTAVLLWLLLLSLARHQLVNALLAAAFLALQVGLLVLMVRVRPSSWSSGPPAKGAWRPPADRP